MIVYVLSLRHAQIAQLVEQWTENPRVTGSIPVLGTFFMPKNSIKRLWRVGCLHTKAHRHLMRKTQKKAAADLRMLLPIVGVRMHGAIGF